MLICTIPLIGTLVLSVPPTFLCSWCGHRRVPRAYPKILSFCSPPFSRAHARACFDDPSRDSYTLVFPFRSIFLPLMSTSPTHTLSQCATVNNSVEALNEEKTVVACHPTSSSQPSGPCSKNTQADAVQNQQPAVVVSRLRFFLIMTSLWIGNFTAYLNETTSTTAMHVISADFNDLANQNWLATGYLLGFTVTQTLLGKFSDIFGRAQVLLGTMLIFGAGTLWCGLATVGILAFLIV
jgi:hypothetical protein